MSRAATTKFFRLGTLIISLSFVVVVIGQADIVKPNAKGRDVVEAVCSLIEASCVFDDDKLFTRRLAYVESYDGEDTSKFPPGYFGGIWQVVRSLYICNTSIYIASYATSRFEAALQS